MQCLLDVFRRLILRTTSLYVFSLVHFFEITNVYLRLLVDMKGTKQLTVVIKLGAS